LRRRFVIAIAGVAALAVLLFAVPLGWVLARTYRDDELVRLQRDTVAATRAIDYGGSADPVELPPGTDQLSVYDRSGRRVAGSGPSRADALVLEALRSARLADEQGGGELRVAVPLLENERVTGAVRAARPDSGAGGDVRRAWLLLAALAVAVVALAVVAARILGRRLAVPLERVAVAAARLGDGDFAVRAPRARIQEVDDVARALDATAGRLGELLARERAFAADASHQLRTPLAALRIELESLELRGESSDEVVAALAQVDRLEATIETLLAVARDAPQQREAADVGPMLDELEVRWRGELAAASRPLHVRIGDRPLRARASPLVVAEILDVLIDNARRHGQGEVDVSARPASSFVAIDVSDDGPGFDVRPEVAFERRHGGGDGHGIGLALARSLAHAEGGRLDVTNAGPGATVRLLLPREP
jgi:signal transduction histidine kinase